MKYNKYLNAFMAGSIAFFATAVHANQHNIFTFAGDECNHIYSYPSVCHGNDDGSVTFNWYTEVAAYTFSADEIATLSALKAHDQPIVQLNVHGKINDMWGYPQFVVKFMPKNTIENEEAYTMHRLYCQHQKNHWNLSCHFDLPEFIYDGSQSLTELGEMKMEVVSDLGFFYETDSPQLKSIDFIKHKD